MKRLLLSTLLATLLVSAGYYFYFSLPDVAVLKQKNPATTALIELREREYKKHNIRGPRRQTWVSYGAVSEHIKKAILVSEDAAFFSHTGVDMT
jgi:monofunctional biosynthetic peptidoglycan transglycosylase